MITQLTLSPNPVNAGQGVVLSVVVLPREITIFDYLIDENSNYLLDENGDNLVE